MITTLGGRQAFTAGDETAELVILQPVSFPEEQEKQRTAKELKKLSAGKKFYYAAFQIGQWNHDLAPWDAPPVRGDQGFTGGAEETLRFMLDALIPDIEKRHPDVKRKYIIAGYSLGGLFALWAAYQTDLFIGTAGVSPSVWFKDWISYASVNSVQSRYVYLSVGKKEEKTNHPVMKEVGNCLRKTAELTERDGAVTVLEYNNGNHFLDPDLRTARGIAKLMDLCEPDGMLKKE